MQYILTQEEYGALVNKANTLPPDALLAFTAAKHHILTANNFVCIYERKDSPIMDYCDFCPLAKEEPKTRNYICTSTKRWSK